MEKFNINITIVTILLVSIPQLIVKFEYEIHIIGT